MKVIGFALCSFVAGVAGCLLGYSEGNLSVSSFAAIVSVTLVATVYLGGITSFGGAIIAGLIAPLGIVYTFMYQTLHVGNYYAILIGLGLILAAIFMPSGLAGATRETVDRLRTRRAAGGEAGAAAVVREHDGLTVTPPGRVVELAGARLRSPLGEGRVLGRPRR